ncbi:glycosyltransferase family 1 protein [Phycicoccus sp. HDW14]|uniref:glycosyltransferase family protein n=1 Tax=Phycicoccus sp. HDW14 TaxID=2714941 RepID=UPI0014084BA6|nr:glycosyltransferase [Phycicoccus sp. HDW14]QIM21341.1 glycosyltransferase family 1 protein [Phycicoccus sp. HDW14]
MTGPSRVLVLSPAFHGYWRPLERALTGLGHGVTTVRYDEHRGLGRVAAKLGHDLPERLGGADSRRRALLGARARAAVTGHDPEVLLVVKGDAFDDGFWELVEQRRQRRVLWLYDELRRTGHTEVSLGAAGPIASYSPLDVAALGARGLRAAHVPLAHDPDEPLGPPRPTDEVVFVGARYPAREALLTGLAARGVPVRAHGRDWSGHPVDRLRTWRLGTPRVAAGRDLTRPDAYAAMAGARATLNVHGDQDGFTMRTFEACGVGAVQLVDRADVSRYYEPGTEVAVFDGVEEAAELARRAATDHAWATGLRRAGAARTRGEHTFTHRARALEALWTA